ncbi:collagen alpha-1(II) chain [Nelusetta ayraudi]|uniref:collagen alpha-1(II) chain n=1 Tax=Nelusetta ayraudi TaxID=303726 RepID=UPI003F71EADA
MKGLQGDRGDKGVKGRRGPPGKPGAVGHRSTTQRQQSGPKPGPRSEPTRTKRPRTERQDDGRRHVSKRWSGDEADGLLNWPQGTKDDPATTCYELGLMHSHLKDGYFYIDPNQGCPCDAVKVYCNFTAGGSTCIDPVYSQIQISWRPKDKSNLSVHWFSQQRAGKKLEYSGVDVVQLRFMQFHSLTSFQHMTIRCTSSQARLLGTVNSIKGSIHLLGDSGNEIGSRLTTVVSGDGEIVVVVKAQGNVEQHQQDKELLPVRDFGVDTRSLSALESEFTVDIGPICFL